MQNWLAFSGSSFFSARLIHVSHTFITHQTLISMRIFGRTWFSVCWLFHLLFISRSSTSCSKTGCHWTMMWVRLDTGRSHAFSALVLCRSSSRASSAVRLCTGVRPRLETRGDWPAGTKFATWTANRSILRWPLQIVDHLCS